MGHEDRLDGESLAPDFALKRGWVFLISNMTPEQVEAKFKMQRDTMVELSKEMATYRERLTKVEGKTNRILDHLGIPRETKN